MVLPIARRPSATRRSSPGGTHGYLPDQPDMLGSLVIWGHGVKRGARIEIRLKSFTKLNEVPNRNGKITLKLERDDFERGEQVVAQLQKDIGEHQLSTPPTRTPVSRLFDESEEDETKKLD